MCFINDNICPLIWKRHIFSFNISIICRLIFNAHINVTNHKKICRSQPTTSYHIVLEYPILARVLAQNFSNFEFIHVTLCVCSFRMALIVQNDYLRDPLKVWNSQGYRFTVSLYFLSDRRWAFVPTQDTCNARHFWSFSSFLFYYNLVQFFFSITLISDGFVSWVSSLHLFMENFDVAACARLPWGLVTWRESVEEDCQSAIYKATRPVYCIASHHEPCPDQLHNSIPSHQWQSSPIFGLFQ